MITKKKNYKLDYKNFPFEVNFITDYYEDFT